MAWMFAIFANVWSAINFFSHVVSTAWCVIQIANAKRHTGNVWSARTQSSERNFRPKLKSRKGKRMATYKREGWHWMDATVNGVRYREPLGTKDWREAQRL